MKRLVLAMLLVPSLALAAEETKAATPSEDPMAGWVPPKVKNAAKDKQEIQALFRTMETASKKGDLEAAAALVDFPVMMMTDDSKGEAVGEAWTREQWTQVMKPFYDKPMKDMKVTHNPEIFLLSDSLATVNDSWKMTQGGKTLAGKNSMFVVRKDGQWRVKAMAEGGWGDMMAAEGTAGAAQGSPSESTGSAGTTGSGTQDPAAPSPGPGPMAPDAGSATPPPASDTPGSTGTTGSGTKDPAVPPGTHDTAAPPAGTEKQETERTTK